MDITPKHLFQRVLDFARKELERHARPHEAGTLERAPREPARASHEPGPVEARGLEVLRSPAGGLLTLRWAVSASDVARAQGLLSGSSVLCVRLVNFTKARDDVRREVQDRPGVELTGQCEIAQPSQRAVVALGLRAGERFVSISHHVI